MRTLHSKSTVIEVMLIAGLASIFICAGFFFTMPDQETAFAQNECIGARQRDDPPRMQWRKSYKSQKGRSDALISCFEEARCRYKSEENVTTCMMEKGYEKAPTTAPSPEPDPMPLPVLRDM